MKTTRKGQWETPAAPNMLTNSIVCVAALLFAPTVLLAQMTLGEDTMITFASVAQGKLRPAHTTLRQSPEGATEPSRAKLPGLQRRTHLHRAATPAILTHMNCQIIHGDLLNQPVDAIVNPWNRNIIPWWLLIPQGVSGAIKKRAGLNPFREVARHGPIPLGHAVLTTAGRLPHKAIIHVAGINMLWRSSESTIRKCVRSATKLAAENNYRSIAFPLIGTGSGRFNKQKALQVMTDELNNIQSEMQALLVQYKP